MMVETRVIKVESDVAATGDWSSGQDEDGNFTVYLQAVPVGILRNLYDQDLFESEFQVEGRVNIGDQASLDEDTNFFRHNNRRYFWRWYFIRPK